MRLNSLPRHVIVALLLLPVLWVGVVWTDFKVEIQIECNATGVRLTVNGQTTEVPLRLGDLREISVVDTRNFFPIGGGSLELVSASPDSPVRYSLPRRFDFHDDKVSPVGDWWVDSQAPRTEVFRHWASAPLPFVVRTTLTGRSIRSRELWLRGDVEIGFAVRAGFINNDMHVLRKDLSLVEGGGLLPQAGIDGRHALHWLVSGAFMAALCTVLFHLAAFVSWRYARVELPWLQRPPALAVVLILNALLGLWVASFILDGRPHFQDDLGYLLRAKWLLAGHLYYPPPENADHFAIPFTMVANGHWLSHYPIGWPALLVIGEGLHAPWIVAPFCGFVTALVSWLLARTIAGGVVGLAAAVLLTLSPLNLILSGSMLSHAGTAMWLAIFVWLFSRGWKQENGWRSLALAGIALGFAFSTRPLSGVATGVAAGGFVVFEMARRRFSSRAWQSLAALVLGGVVGALPAMLDNWMVTGNPLTFAYNLGYSEIWTPRAYAVGLFWTDRMLALMPALAFGWGWPTLSSCWPVAALTFGFAFVPFFSGRATRFDWLLLAVLFALPLAYLGFNAGTGLHAFGPRYYVDNLFALMLLTARGFQILAQSGRSIERSALPRLLALLLFLALTGSTAWNLRRRLERYHNYNDVDNRIERRLAEASLQRGLILLGPPTYLNWIRAARLLPTDLRAPLVFAEAREDNSKLLRDYAGWPVYIIDDSSLKPYSELK